MIGFVIGGAIGVVIIRAFILDEIEVLAFNMFWDSIKEKDLAFDMKTILNSTTFLKCSLSFLVGGILGGFAQRSLKE